nr:SulP family inorganic anion transporter [Sphingomonas daechungensis]
MKPKLLTTIRDYSWRIFTWDLIAGVTVALVALPLSIAIAIASGADPKAGLVTAIVAGFLISLLGAAGSRSAGRRVRSSSSSMGSSKRTGSTGSCWRR